MKIFSNNSFFNIKIIFNYETEKINIYIYEFNKNFEYYSLILLVLLPKKL